MPIAIKLQSAPSAQGPEQLLPAEVPRPEVVPQRRARTRPHVCFVAPHAWPVFSGDPRIAVVGGAEVQQAILARLFARDGYRVSMIALDYGQPARAEIDGVQALRAFRMQDGIPVLRFVYPRLTTMWRLLREADAELYYYRSASMWVGVLAEFCRRHGRRLVYAGASDKDFVPGQGGQIRLARDRWLYRRGLARAHAIVAQNERQRDDCAQHYGREAVVIPSCYELPPHRVPGDRDRILWVGTLHTGKRPEMFLELAARLPEKSFVMIGGASKSEPELFERVRAQAARLPNLEFKGFLPLKEVEPWFDRARVLVNTSTYEGMPNVFLQAWARGVPTVATVDVGAACQRVAAAIDALALEVESLVGNPSRWEAASRQCKAHFERTHSSASALEHYARLFDRLGS